MIPLDAGLHSSFSVMDGRDMADGVQPIRSDHTIILDLPPSCMEFSPFHADSFVVGTYYLEPESESGTASHTTSTKEGDDQIRVPPQDRSGSLMLFNLNAQRL